MAQTSHVVVEAATVLCIRMAATAPSRRTLAATSYTGGRALSVESSKQFQDFKWDFDSGIQLLMGQSEVVNWVRSTAPDNLAFMRYGGEFKFAGGSKDPGESIEETARRELSEEFMTEIPASAILRPFRVNSTKAIAGKSFVMYNFVCIAEENPWLADLDVDAINTRLHARREEFQPLVAPGGSFWQMPKSDRERVSPEVYQLQWFDIPDVVDMMLVSKAVVCQPVNEFQRTQFAKYSIPQRDPMYASMMTVQALEACGSIEGVRSAATGFQTSSAQRASTEATAQTWENSNATEDKGQSTSKL